MVPGASVRAAILIDAMENTRKKHRKCIHCKKTVHFLDGCSESTDDSTVERTNNYMTVNKGCDKTFNASDANCVPDTQLEEIHNSSSSKRKRTPLSGIVSKKL